MIAVESQVKILPVSVAAIFDDPNSSGLFQANAEECLISDADPQRAIYEAMERAGVMRCRAAYAGDRLIGFISVLCTITPHLGRRIATIESLFVSSEYRPTGAGDLLLDAADQIAADLDCAAITGAARVGSRLEKVLARRSGYELTHSMYTRRLL